MDTFILSIGMGTTLQPGHRDEQGATPVPALAELMSSLILELSMGEGGACVSTGELLPGPEGPPGIYAQRHCKDPSCGPPWGSGSPGTAAEGGPKSQFTASLRTTPHFYGQNWTNTSPLSKEALTTVWVPAPHQRVGGLHTGTAPCGGEG